MPRRRQPVSTSLLRAALVSLVVAFPVELAWTPPLGLVVERVQPALAADLAGLKPGDVLLEWKAAGTGAGPRAGRVFASWLDVYEVERWHAARGAVTVQVERDGKRWSARLLPHEYGLDARPRVTPSLCAAYRAAVGAERPEERARGLRRLANEASALEVRSWLLARLAEERAQQRDAREAALIYTDAAGSYSGPHKVVLLFFAGRAQRWGGLFSGAEASFREALALCAREDPGGLGEAWMLYELGNLARAWGDLRGSEDHHRRALQIREARAPGSYVLAHSLNSLGNIALERRDLASAEEAYERSSRIFDGLGFPNPASHINLAEVVRRRGDLDRAEAHLSRALEASAARGGWREATVRHELGRVLEQRGDLAGAAEQLSKALQGFEARGDDRVLVPRCLLSLASVALKRSDATAARAYVERALLEARRLLPGGLIEAETLHALAQVEMARGDWAGARPALERAIEIQGELSPGSAEEASTAAALGRVFGELHQTEMALGFYRRAVASLERQQARAGGGEQGLIAFRASQEQIYEEALIFLLDAGRGAEAFQLIERARARALLMLFGETAIWSRVPDALTHERRAINGRVEGALERLGALSTSARDEPERRLLRREIQEALERKDQILREARGGRGDAAGPSGPAPLDVGGAARALDPGTVLLAYAVGAKETVLFVLPAGGALQIHRLPVPREELRRRIGAFRACLAKDGRLGTGQEASAAHELTNLLLGPEAAEIAAAHRLMIVPDGPLHALPFAALFDPLDTRHRLVEGKSLHYAASATVFAELKARRRALVPRVVAFADPEFETKAVLVAGGDGLRRLPATRREAVVLSRLFGPASRVFVGPEATKARLRQEAPRAGILHLASHAIVDERFPLNSVLALAPDPHGGVNGLLHAWEVAEELKLDADLVTLSACDTARGAESPGEGILGFTRAFQSAGARSVLATLWATEDEATADLMSRFYGYLSRGLTKDEALAQAQREMIHSGVPPGRWAGFALVGDWR